MTKDEWQVKYNITDDEMDMIAYIKNITNGKINSADNPKLDYEIIKLT